MSPYLKEAPPRLVELHRDGKLRNGRDTLRRLLTGKDMAPTWTALRKAMSRSEFESVALWGVIMTLSVQSRRKPISPREESARLRKISRKVAELRKDICLDAPGAELRVIPRTLDRLLFHFFPDDVLAANGIRDWGSLTEQERDASAHRLLGSWPSISEILERLESLARAEAQRPGAAYPGRDRAIQPALFFMRGLVDYFRRKYGRPMHSSVAKITSIVFSGREFGADDAKRADERRGTKKRVR